MEKVSILIPCYNNEMTICKAIDSCVFQDYPSLEIIVSDNRSIDRTPTLVSYYPQVFYHKTKVNKGGTYNMNGLLKLATGDYLVMLCADDYFTSPKVISYIARIFKAFPEVGFIGRYYYHFLDGFDFPIRTFRSQNPYRSADQWSGLAFRNIPFELKHSMFVETVAPVKELLDKGWDYRIIGWDTVAVRTTKENNGSQVKKVYEHSPIKNWVDLIGKDYEVLTNFVSLIQIKNWGTFKALIREIYLFIKYKPTNLFRVDFWFFSLVSLLAPRFLLKELVWFYKLRIGRHFVKEIKCPK